MRAYEPPQCSPLRLFWSDEASCGGFEWDGRSEAEHVEEMAINRGIVGRKLKVRGNEWIVRSAHEMQQRGQL